jgi:hypothetical protein
MVSLALSQCECGRSFYPLEVETGKEFHNCEMCRTWSKKKREFSWVSPLQELLSRGCSYKFIKELWYKISHDVLANNGRLNQIYFTKTNNTKSIERYHKNIERLNRETVTHTRIKIFDKEYLITLSFV